MKIPPKSPLNALDLTPKKLGNPGAAGRLAKLSSDLKSQLAKPAKSHHDQITEQTQKWVSQTFFGTLLKQMDDSPFKSELFSGGRGGQAFSSLYHQQLADRIARGAGHKLVNTIVRRIEAKQAYQKQQGSAAKGTVPATPPADASAALKRHEGRFHGRRNVAAAPRA